MTRPSSRLARFAGAAALMFSLSGAAACGGKMQANVEYPGGIDFSSYRSYRWITEDLVLIQSGGGNPNIRNVENEKRIRAAVERELNAKGMTKGAEEADLVLAFTVGTKVRYRIEGGEFYDIISSGPGGTITRGTLTLYFFDPRRNLQIWEAWTSQDLEPGADPDTVINTAVNLLLSKYPPAK